MNKHEMSNSDVEQLLAGLAQHDRQLAAEDAAQTELMCAAARGEIRRVFRRRRCLRTAGYAVSLLALGGAMCILQPELRDGGAQSISLAVRNATSRVKPQEGGAVADASPTPVSSISPLKAPAISYSATLGGHDQACEVVIYSVPL